MINKCRTAYSSVFDIYLIQRPCLFSVPATFTQDIISYAGDVRRKPVYRDGYPYSHNSESGHGRQDIRKKHSCSERKNRQDYRHQRFIYRSVAAVEHKQYSYADVAQTFTERQTYNHGCKEGYERI
jgi:hypothetical protein